MPFEYVEMQLCRELHCLPSQLEKEEGSKMELFLEMMNLERQFQEREERLAKQKIRGKRFPKF